MYSYGVHFATLLEFADPAGLQDSIVAGSQVGVQIVKATMAIELLPINGPSQGVDIVPLLFENCTNQGLNRIWTTALGSLEPQFWGQNELEC